MYEDLTCIPPQQTAASPNMIYRIINGSKALVPTLKDLMFIGTLYNEPNHETVHLGNPPNIVALISDDASVPRGKPARLKGSP